MLSWDKVTLTVDEVMQYVDDIVDICCQLDALMHHHKATYDDHLKYGQYAYPYKRSKQTTWNIVYAKDSNNKILVNKIVSNHMTAF